MNIIKLNFYKQRIVDSCIMNGSMQVFRLWLITITDLEHEEHEDEDEGDLDHHHHELGHHVGQHHLEARDPGYPGS